MVGITKDNCDLRNSQIRLFKYFTNWKKKSLFYHEIGVQISLPANF